MTTMTDPIRAAIEKALPCNCGDTYIHGVRGHATSCQAFHREAVFAAVEPLIVTNAFVRGLDGSVEVHDVRGYDNIVEALADKDAQLAEKDREIESLKAKLAGYEGLQSWEQVDKLIAERDGLEALWRGATSRAGDLAAENDSLRADVERLRENDRLAADEVASLRTLWGQYQEYVTDSEVERNSLRAALEWIREADPALVGAIHMQQHAADALDRTKED